MSAQSLAQDAYDELSYYTLAHQDPAFIHQLIVDAFAAQNADESTKPIKLTFALIGLYLHLEKGYSGKQVQRAHMQLAKHRKKWPDFTLPLDRGAITVFDVVKTEPGVTRDQAIDAWCASVWEAYRESHHQIAQLVRAELGV